MYSNLKEYIHFLESRGEIEIIREFTDPVFEITRRTDEESKKEGGGKALLFLDTGTEFPVLTNLMGSEKRMGWVLGLDFEKGDRWSTIQENIDGLAAEMMKSRTGLIEKMKLLPTLTQAARWLPASFSGAAPCQEVTLLPKEGEPLLSRFPILKCWPQDGGRFITFPLVHTLDPMTGARNVGMYRMQVFDEKTTGMHWHRHKTGARHYDEWKRLRPGEKMPVAVALGGDPVYTYCATAPLPDGIDEYLLAGFLRGKAVQLVRCKTQPLEVPADCDIVLEGYVDPAEEKVTEGPFGDHTGFYSLADLYPEFHLTAITHRRQAVYPATIVGIPPMEDKYIALATEKIFLSPVKLALCPEVMDMHLPEEGTGHNFAVIKIDKRYPGQAQKVASALWGAGQMMFNKFMVIVGSETDVNDRKSISKAIESNYLPERDTVLTRGPLDILDHTAPICGYGGKMAIDATVKLPEETACNQGPMMPEKNDYQADAIYPLTKNIDLILDEDRGRYTNLWLLGGNCDPVRDSFLSKGKLILDARSKKHLEGFKREWPDEVKFS